MTGLMGKDIVPEGTAFNQPEIEAALKRQGNMKINKGDVVIFYTGWHKLLGVDNKRNGSVEPGLGFKVLRYLASLGVAMIGSDTWAVEVIPFETKAKCSTCTKFCWLKTASSFWRTSLPSKL
jgi:kynurenine formamidase